MGLEISPRTRVASEENIAERYQAIQVVDRIALAWYTGVNLDNEQANGGCDSWR